MRKTVATKPGNYMHTAHLQPDQKHQSVRLHTLQKTQEENLTLWTILLLATSAIPHEMSRTKAIIFAGRDLPRGNGEQVRLL